MTLPNFDDSMSDEDEVELETLTEYLTGRLSMDEEIAFEDRLDRDSAFRGRMRPVLKECYNDELVPIEIELGRRLVERGLLRPSSLAPRPRRRRDRGRMRYKKWERRS